VVPPWPRWTSPQSAAFSEPGKSLRNLKKISFFQNKIASLSRSREKSKSKSVKSPSKRKSLRELAKHYFNQKEIHSFFENSKNIENQRAFSILIFRAAMVLARQVNKKMDQFKFFQTLFSVLNQNKLNEENTRAAYEILMSNLDFFDVQELKIYLVYYLHQYPKGNAVPGLSYKTILEKMIQRGIVNNQKFITEEARFIEALTPEQHYHSKLRDIISAFLFGTHNEYLSSASKVKQVSREQLLKELRECRRKCKCKSK
jgi:hypothetical protein